MYGLHFFGGVNMSLFLNAIPGANINGPSRIMLIRQTIYIIIIWDFEVRHPQEKDLTLHFITTTHTTQYNILT